MRTLDMNEVANVSGGINWATVIKVVTDAVMGALASKALDAMFERDPNAPAGEPRYDPLGNPY